MASETKQHNSDTEEEEEEEDESSNFDEFLDNLEDINITENSENFDMSSLLESVNDIQDNMDYNNHCYNYLVNNVQTHINNHPRHAYPKRLKTWYNFLWNTGELCYVKIEMKSLQLQQELTKFFKSRKKPRLSSIYNEIIEDTKRHIEEYYTMKKKNIKRINNAELKRLTEIYSKRTRKIKFNPDIIIKCMIKRSILYPLFRLRDNGNKIKLIVLSNKVKFYTHKGYEYDKLWMYNDIQEEKDNINSNESDSNESDSNESDSNESDSNESDEEIQINSNKKMRII